MDLFEALSAVGCLANAPALAQQDAPIEIAGGLVVLDDQNLAPSGAGHGVERGHEVARIDGLDQKGGPSKGDTPLAAGAHRGAEHANLTDPQSEEQGTREYLT